MTSQILREPGSEALREMLKVKDEETNQARIQGDIMKDKQQSRAEKVMQRWCVRVRVNQ